MGPLLILKTGYLKAWKKLLKKIIVPCSIVHFVPESACEHDGKSFRTGSLLCHPPHSAIMGYAFTCNVRVKENDFSIGRAT